jgi:hypothetical protein
MTRPDRVWIFITKTILIENGTTINVLGKDTYVSLCIGYNAPYSFLKSTKEWAGSMALLKHVTHYGWWSGCPLYNLVTPMERDFPICHLGTGRIVRWVKPWNVSPVPHMIFAKSLKKKNCLPKTQHFSSFNL